MNSQREQSNNLLREVGFDIIESTITGTSLWGNIKPEPYSVGKNHFKPYFRDVYVGECNGGYYVSSHIVGDYREYRCRRTYPNTNIANIYAWGTTMVEDRKSTRLNSSH